MPATTRRTETPTPRRPRSQAPPPVGRSGAMNVRVRPEHVRAIFQTLQHARQRQQQQPAAPVVIAPPPPPAADAVNVEAVDDDAPTCAVCMDALDTKRVLTLLPCAHRLHRTCVLQWLETRCCSDSHQCPLCRARVRIAQSDAGDLTTARAFGETGQPTKKRMLIFLSHTNQNRVDAIKALKTEAEYAMVMVRRDMDARALETRESPGRPTPADDEYLADCSLELVKLARREAILGEMEQAQKQGWLTAAPGELYINMDKPWCPIAERAAADRQRRVGASVFGSSMLPAHAPGFPHPELIVIDRDSDDSDSDDMMDDTDDLPLRPFHHFFPSRARMTPTARSGTARGRGRGRAAAGTLGAARTRAAAAEAAARALERERRAAATAADTAGREARAAARELRARVTSYSLRTRSVNPGRAAPPPPPARR